jgi:hypothetical protein
MKIDDIDDGLFHLHAPRSVNNKLIVEMYKKEALKAVEKNGFASISQKLTLKGLKVLIEAKLTDNTLVLKDSVAYVKEELLYTSAWAQKALECEAIGEPFLIVDMVHVEFIVPPEG